MCCLASKHLVNDYFLITARPVVFYTLLILFNICLHGVAYSVINHLWTVPPRVLFNSCWSASTKNHITWTFGSNSSSFMILKFLLFVQWKKNTNDLFTRKLFSHSWTWKLVNPLTLRHAFCQCRNCLISTHFIHQTWKKHDQDAPRSPAGIWGNLRELDWLSASEGIFSVGVMRGSSVESQLDLSTARHVTLRRNPLTSLQGWCWSASAARHTVTVSERIKKGIGIQIQSLSSIHQLHVQKLFWQ